ncbi:MAG: dolichyl-phosphate beta-glucosyltransferase [Bryobacteraceae bacterium]
MRSVSIVIPAYNEEQRLPGSLDEVLNYAQSRRFSFVEILVVDDGSTDKTAAVVESVASRHPSVRLLRNSGNRGKGFSVKHGMLEARGDWILSTDADLSAPIDQLDMLLKVALDRNVDVVLGSRALDRSLIGVHQSASREYAGRVFNLIMRLITGLPFKDTQCGFKLYSRKAARQIFPRQRLDGFGFDVESLFLALQLGFDAIEVPVRWNNVEGTKVTLYQGLNSFLDPLRVRLNHLLRKYRYAD